MLKGRSHVSSQNDHALKAYALCLYGSQIILIGRYTYENK